MTQTVRSVLADLAIAVPPTRAAGWDPIGLQIGDPDGAVRRAAVCHEVTDAVAEALEGATVDLLVAYHPLIFRPLSRLIAGTSPGGRALRLARAGVAVTAVHTAFDAAPGGTSDALAAALGLSEVAAFGPTWGSDSIKVVTFAPAAAADRIEAAMADAGAGAIGNYTRCAFRTSGVGVFHAGEGTDPASGVPGDLNTEPEFRVEMVAPVTRKSAVTAALVGAHPYEEPAFDVYPVSSNAGFIGRVGRPEASLPLLDFATSVGRALSTRARYSGDPSHSVTRVAVVPGSGSAFIDDASSLADVLVTGDLSHHQARAAGDQGLAVVDAGHVPTERPGVARLYAAVSAIVPKTVDLTGLDSEPWKEV